MNSAERIARAEKNRIPDYNNVIRVRVIETHGDIRISPWGTTGNTWTKEYETIIEIPKK